MAENDFLELFRDLGELVQASRALEIADAATKEAVDKAVLEAGRAVSETIARDDDADVSRHARESLTQCRNVIDLLRLEIARSRALAIESTSLRTQSAEQLQWAQLFQDDLDLLRKKV
jgi:hypothetical protein